jgi:two-component system NtrC family sensor kinase
MQEAKTKYENLVFSIKDKCRVCYTCVRECPVKAIKIINGQAEVIQERCIACGNCTRVCSQGAKAFLNSTSNVFRLLKSNEKVAALLAPSFASEFAETDDYQLIVGMLRVLGFDKVFEVAFGADLVAREYKKLMDREKSRGYISSDCPAIVSYIEKYHSDLIGNLVPVVSPMVAMSRYIRKNEDETMKLVFIGPCIAKKSESNEVDEILTFVELREMFNQNSVSFSEVSPSDFDPPAGAKGAIFPISRGLLETINSSSNGLERNIIVAEGRVDFQEAIREYEIGSIEKEHLELLCCEGCIMGPGTSKNGMKFARRSRILNYVNQKPGKDDSQSWEKSMENGKDLDLSRNFYKQDQSIPDPDEESILKVLESMNKKTYKDHLNCGACGYDTCRNHAIAIIKGLAETEMCLPHAIDKLHHSINDLAVSNEKLMSVQQVLKQTEKLAHMGQLSAGIAHELNNPLGVVIMYANILLEELEEENELHADMKLIAEQAERCKSIVGGLLNFARKNQVNHRETDLNELVRISLDSVIKPDNIQLFINSLLNNPFADLDQEQMVQVISNLIRNAFEAMPAGGELNINLSDSKDQVKIKISDSGTGISDSDLQKVFEPFFTTKGIGKGTGLGLATAYGVVKMHKGKIDVESNADPADGPTFTRFIIQLPRKTNF